MALEVRKYPDPVLLQVAEPVTEFDGRLRAFIEEMFLTMYEKRGVGLAAPQVGLSKRIYVINTDDGQPPESELVFINPEVVHVDGEQYSDEGCLSFPGIFAKKKRPNEVTMKAQNAKGEPFEITAEGFAARALLHELDHLNGIVFVQDLEPQDYIQIRKPLEKMKRAFKKRVHA